MIVLWTFCEIVITLSLRKSKKNKQLEFYVQTAENNFNRIKSKRIMKLEQARDIILENGGSIAEAKIIDEMIERIARNIE